MGSIELDVCEVEDGTLIVLAETYRNRMKAPGLGVPAAWTEHVLTDARVQATVRKEASTTGSKSSSDNGDKVFTNGHVPGGLRRLYLRGSREITNKGGRTILRSCVGLEFLDIGATFKLTLELFQGPWACSRSRDLNMSAMALETRTRRRTILMRVNYDHMTTPLEEYDDDDNEVRGNTPRQRTILREFYSKLGQLSQLWTLNMSYGNYRVRVKDRLELVLPGLHQNLTSWKVAMENGYQMGASEVEFLGKHFGYGQDFSVEKDDDQDQLEGKTRKAQLERLVLDAEAVRHVRREVKDWASRQGLDLELGYRGSDHVRGTVRKYTIPSKTHVQREPMSEIKDALGLSSLSFFYLQSLRIHSPPATFIIPYPGNIMTTRITYSVALFLVAFTMVGSMISAAPAPPESMVQFSTWDDPAPLKTTAWCDSPE
ncbi:hypothetical protein KVV02_003908 [Mortierella alpina]|uniref:Uncharacterized protein n=1 Tax=Mortierella alpina TaxID=64518 RepID=A0A9P8CWN0_MORAP|nr:hypothetical protein KVV02_003908 [Mortierella alpina]